jgi:hypothetical protein
MFDTPGAAKSISVPGLDGRNLQDAGHGLPHLTGFDPGIQRLLRGQPVEFGEDVVARPRAGVAGTQMLIHPGPEVSETHSGTLTSVGCPGVTAPREDGPDSPIRRRQQPQRVSWPEAR